MIVTKDFFRFVESASATELVAEKEKCRLFLGKMEELGASDYASDARAAIRILNEEMAARYEVDELQCHRKIR